MNHNPNQNPNPNPNQNPNPNPNQNPNQNPNPAPNPPPAGAPQTHTIRLHRVLRTTPERLYQAFIDPDAMNKWLPPNGYTGKVHSIDPRVGGRFKMTFTNFTTGKSHSFGGEFLELTPHQRIRYTDQFDDPNLPGLIHVTVTLQPTPLGVHLHILQEGIPAIIPAPACYLGWQESLTLLAKLVETEIPA